jgi:hypothetical protein
MGGAKNRNRKFTLTIGDLASCCELTKITEGESPKTITGIQTSCARSKLFDEICKLLSGNEEQGRITGPSRAYGSRDTGDNHGLPTRSKSSF